MIEVRNILKHRVFDISDDRKTIYLRLKGCLTIIRIADDGTFIWTHEVIGRKQHPKKIE